MILILCRDLFFTSKITATAKAHALDYQVVRDPAQLGTTAGQILVVDLGLAGALPAAAGWKAAVGGRVIAFASHVETALIHEARQAGLDQVLPRSAFTAQLDALLTT